jgi:hypothetical protein
MPRDSSDLEPNLEAWAAEELKVLGDLGVSTRQFASDLAREVDAVGWVDESGTRHAPDQFNISLNVDDAARIVGAWASLQSVVIEGLQTALQAAGFQVTRRLHISFSTDPTLGRGGVQVIAWHSGDPLKMDDMPEVRPETAPGGPRPDAFLVLAGRRIFRLQSDKVSIGRRLDNDLVIEDRRVSRRHALIQASGGQFLIQDLRSTAGTLVNGRRVRSVALHPGDVIRLAETELVYGESPGEPPTQAAPYEGPPSAEEGPPQDTTLSTIRFDPPVTDKPPEPSSSPSEGD